MDLWVFIKALSLVLCISLIIYILTILLKKQFYKENIGSMIKIISQKQIGQKLEASIIEIDKEKMLIIRSPSSISVVKLTKKLSNNDHKE
jgi:flagellar biogenesis protein FliO